VGLLKKEHEIIIRQERGKFKGRGGKPLIADRGFRIADWKKQENRNTEFRIQNIITEHP
jgi:hypothetical protein